MNVNEFLATQFGLNTGRDFVEALTVFLVSIVILYIFKKIVLLRLKALAKKTTTDLDDYAIQIIDGLHWPFYGFVSLYLALKFLTVPQQINVVEEYILLFFIIFYIIKSVQIIVRVAADKYIVKSQKQDSDSDPTIINVMVMIANIALWAVGLVFILSNFGVNISALIAGLGIGGIAIAFALQNILMDIFASFSIYFDKPFRTGDNIQIGNDSGEVKRIGIKTTRLQTPQGEEMIISNRELTSSRIQNFKKMKKRRVVFNFAVDFDTPAAKLEKIPETIEKIVKEIKEATAERSFFKQYGQAGIIYEVSYFVNSPDFNTYSKIQNEISLQIKAKLEKMGIKFVNSLLVPK